jgi:hypothetical protein
MSDQFGTIRRLYERLGREYTVEAERRMREFLVSHPGDGKSRYRFADTGLDERELREQTAAYLQRYGVPAEPVR